MLRVGESIQLNKDTKVLRVYFRHKNGNFDPEQTLFMGNRLNKDIQFVSGLYPMAFEKVDADCEMAVDVLYGDYEDKQGEFISINIEEERKLSFRGDKTRYLAFSASVMDSVAFKDTDCVIGVECRDKLGQKVDKYTQSELEFELNSKTAFTIPLLIDINEMRIYWIDVDYQKIRKQNTKYQSNYAIIRDIIDNKLDIKEKVEV